MAANPKLIDKLYSRLPPDGERLVRAIVAKAEGCRVFLVGGPVRDLLLGRALKDVDLAVEGDAVAVAGAAAVQIGAEVLKRSQFGTVTVRLGGAEIDVVTARAETYRRPGALPSIRPATIEADLLRRDFTVNAMAVELTDGGGSIVDPAGGQDDLRIGTIRVLHDGSFRDDATRILRAVRYEGRLGFAIDTTTLTLLGRDLPYLSKISGARIRRELQRMLNEDDPAAIFRRADELGVLAALHPALHFTPEQVRGMRWLNSECVNPPALWPVLCWGVGSEDVASLGARLALTRTELEAVASAVRIRAIEGEIRRCRRTSEVDRLLSSTPVPSLYAGAAMVVPIRKRVLDYVRRIRHIRPRLRGDDLPALGVTAGPMVGEMLERLRAARLDGEASTRAEEERLVREMIKAEGRVVT